MEKWNRQRIRVLWMYFVLFLPGRITCTREDSGLYVRYFEGLTVVVDAAAI